MSCHMIAANIIPTLALLFIYYLFITPKQQNSTQNMKGTHTVHWKKKAIPVLKNKTIKSIRHLHTVTTIPHKSYCLRSMNGGWISTVVCMKGLGLVQKFLFTFHRGTTSQVYFVINIYFIKILIGFNLLLINFI